MPSPASDDVYRHPWEKIASEYLDQVREGAPASIEDLVSQCDEDAGEVKELLQLVSAMENWKTRRELSTMRQAMPEQFRFERLGDFRLIREIGRGGMGVVFEAHQESMNRRVALKLLPWRFPKASRLRERFQHEAVLAAKLHHRHIVPVYQFGEQDGWCYYVMHLVPGVGLDRVIRHLAKSPHRLDASEVLELFQRGTVRGPAAVASKADALTGGTMGTAITRQPWWRRWFFPERRKSSRSPGSWSLAKDNWTQIAKFGLQVAEGLKYAHAAGVLHRDIKPGNLILDGRRRLWIADFGLAQLNQQDAPPNDDQIAGTLRYIAPEQLAGFPEVRSDLYALGMTLYELCVLRPAFSEQNRTDLIRAVREKLPLSPQNINQRCPTELSRIVMQAIAKNPEDRPQSAAEMIGQLSAFLKERREKTR